MIFRPKLGQLYVVNPERIAGNFRPLAVHHADRLQIIVMRFPQHKIQQIDHADPRNSPVLLSLAKGVAHQLAAIKPGAVVHGRLTPQLHLNVEQLAILGLRAHVQSTALHADVFGDQAVLAVHLRDGAHRRVARVGQHRVDDLQHSDLRGFIGKYAAEYRIRQRIEADDIAFHALTFL